MPVPPARRHTRHLDRLWQPEIHSPAGQDPRPFYTTAPRLVGTRAEARRRCLVTNLAPPSRRVGRPPRPPARTTLAVHLRQSTGARRTLPPTLSPAPAPAPVRDVAFLGHTTCPMFLGTTCPMGDSTDRENQNGRQMAGPWAGPAHRLPGLGRRRMAGDGGEGTPRHSIAIGTTIPSLKSRFSNFQDGRRNHCFEPLSCCCALLKRIHVP